MLGFGSRPKRVTKDELEDVDHKVSYKLSDRKRDALKTAFGPALHGSDERGKGIDHDELEAGLYYLQEHASYDDDEIEAVRYQMKKHLRD